ncbi:hypothetical protein Nepgr_030375 [Nepenthes gracilis]|uniref:t-SNARE coiled-coil homology domain-containing protein n=1 Tax=Nepenthes gracilis TaxID=150966 RepID=A0AAD3TGV8_NEPGR|nr:hypothetical protein Nepgr_030375 [Nepenthes gracilis]
MSHRRDHRATRAAPFDGLDDIEGGGLRASSSSSNHISEHDNEKAIDSLKDKVIFLKRLTGDIHDEVLSHNLLLDQMGNGMDASRGILSRTLDRFKMVFEKKSGRKMYMFIGCFGTFLIFCYLIRLLRYFI